MAVAGQYKVTISPDLSDFKDVAKSLRSSIESSMKGLNVDFNDAFKDTKAAGEAGKKTGEDFVDGLEHEIDKAGGGLGDKVGGLLKGAGKFAAAGVGVAAGALATLAGASVKSYADYEQYIGGVDKLFGDASGKLQGYASQAYRTSGLSANDYMEQVTSFSASLIGSLGGDTAKAADIADMAMSDMADNANTFGTSIESIQNAYQGFAKGNFSMLDNLKLGYGGTSAEMAKLLNDSGVLEDGMVATATNLNEIGFDKMIEGINAIQTEMSITGTTAKEGSETISGALGSTLAGWENVVTGFAVGGDFLEGAIEGFALSIADLAGNILNILPQVFSGITLAIQELLPTLLNLLGELIPQIADLLVTALPLLITTIISALPELIQTLLDAILTLAPMLISLIVEIALSIVEMLPEIIGMLVVALIALVPMLLDGALQLFIGLVEALPIIITELVGLIPELIGQVIASLIAMLPVLIEGAIQLFTALLIAMPQIIMALIGELPNLIGQVIGGLLSTLPALLEGAITLFTAIFTGMSQIIPNLATQLPAMLNNIFGGIDWLGMLVNAGKWLVEGLGNGLSSMTDWAMNQITKLGESISNGIKNFFGIASPSKLMHDLIGVNIGLGIGEGIADSASMIQGDIDDLNNNVLGGLQTQYSLDGGGVGNTTIVNQTVQKPETLLDIQLNTQKGILLGGKNG